MRRTAWVGSRTSLAQQTRQHGTCEKTHIYVRAVQRHNQRTANEQNDVQNTFWTLPRRPAQIFCAHTLCSLSQYLRINDKTTWECHLTTPKKERSAMWGSGYIVPVLIWLPTERETSFLDVQDAKFGVKPRKSTCTLHCLFRCKNVQIAV